MATGQARHTFLPGLTNLYKSDRMLVWPTSVIRTIDANPDLPKCSDKPANRSGQISVKSFQSGLFT